MPPPIFNVASKVYYVLFALLATCYKNVLLLLCNSRYCFAHLITIVDMGFPMQWCESSLQWTSCTPDEMRGTHSICIHIRDTYVN